MANKVFLNDNGIVEIIVDGAQTYESVQQMGTEALAMCQELKRQGKHPLILDNLLKIGKVPPEARKLVVEFVKANDYDKLAMVGSSGVLRIGANLMLQATGKGSRVKYFVNYGNATDWLLA